jgi:hypothetical protein
LDSSSPSARRSGENRSGGPVLDAVDPGNWRQYGGDYVFNPANGYCRCGL